MTSLLDVLLPPLVMLVMAVVGMDTRPADFARVRARPVAIPALVLGQWLAAMVIAVLLARAAWVPRPMAFALLLVAAAPAAPVSTYYAQLSRGAVALAITMTAVSSVVATGATPLVAAQGFRWALGADALFALPVTQVAQQVFIALLLPVAAGMALRAWAPAWVEARRPRLQGLSLAAIVVVVVGVLADQWGVVRHELAGFLPAAILFTAALLVAGAMVAAIALPAGPDRRAVLWGFPARNVAVAVLLANGTLPRGPVAAAVAVAFVVQACLAVPLAYWLGRRRLQRAAVSG